MTNIFDRRIHELEKSIRVSWGETVIQIKEFYDLQSNKFIPCAFVDHCNETIHMVKNTYVSDKFQDVFVAMLRDKGVNYDVVQDKDKEVKS